MRRGSTATLTFEIDKKIDCSQIDKLEIDFGHGKNIVLVKEISDCSINGNEISVTLSEEETLRFDYKKNPVAIQLRIGIGGARIPTPIVYRRIEDVIREGGL